MLYTVFAQRVVSESTIIEASSEAEAMEKAMEMDNTQWNTDEDLDWEITSARAVE